MSELYSITVSTNYADLLGHIIDQNQKFFTKWYIITAKDDQKTIDVIQHANYSHIEILYFDFKKGGAKFNKGGALQMAQKLVMKNHGEGVNVLIVDSDIYLPDEFGKIYENLEVEPDKLYGMTKRIDYFKYSDFLNRENGIIHLASIDFIGCFQLYKQTTNKLYVDSDNCGWCDFIFRDIFLKQKGPDVKWNDLSPVYDIQRIEYYKSHNCVYLPITIFHLGNDYMNWDGRVAGTDFINDAHIDTHAQYENKLINTTMHIYTKKQPAIYNTLFAKCKFLPNNILEVKLNKHTINGIYKLLEDNIVKISFYSHELLCVLNRENKNINITSINHNINYFGTLVQQ